MKRSIWLVAVAAALVGALVAGVVLAWLHPGVDRTSITHSTETIPVTAPVERRPSRSPVELSAVVTEPTTMELMPNGAPTTGSIREVVSWQVAHAGDVLYAGDLVGEVSGRPVFALPDDVPLYRDIVEDMTGSDVVGLQQVLISRGLLHADATGWFGPLTKAALIKLFQDAGYCDESTLADGKVGLALANTVSLPADGVRVRAAAARGTVLEASGSASSSGASGSGQGGSIPYESGSTGDSGADAESDGTTSALVEVEIRQAMLTARVDLLQAGRFPVGAAVSVYIGTSGPAAGAVTSVSGFMQAGSSQPAGYDVMVSVPDELVTVADSGQSARLVEIVESIPTALAVPLAAVRQDDAGTFVLVPVVSGSDPPLRVQVTVQGQTDGYALLDVGADLPEGSLVLISG
ncbi:MAG: peptidoglycan-binding protein [Propionibacteriaceae bacterium]|jgi:hypothetical protein|nr:peptidoglycan-binding protein [Propionibacteriaceae bacterium]